MPNGVNLTSSNLLSWDKYKFWAETKEIAWDNLE